MTQYLVTTPDLLTAYSKAINAAVGLATPIRGVTVGGPDFVPLAYTPGCAGWTDTMYRGSWVTADLSEACVEIAPAMLAFAGQTVGDLTFPPLSAAVDTIPARFLPENGAKYWDGSPLHLEQLKAVASSANATLQT